MKRDTYFEKELPDGYKQVLHINATNAKIGLLLNAIAMIVFIGVAAIALLLARDKITLFSPSENLLDKMLSVVIFSLIFLALIFIYMILHELTHGAFYKLLTGERLTYGISWSCAFCGVVHIYTYRKTALIASAAPLVIYTALLSLLSVILYFVSGQAFLLCAFLFGMHLGGCAGDIYVILLLLFRFKDKKTLIRDTGPEQFFFLSNIQASLDKDGASGI